MQSMVEGAGRSSELIAAAIVSHASDQECRASGGSVDYFAAARERARPYKSARPRAAAAADAPQTLAKQRELLQKGA
jgi:hypothetical protein